MVTWRPYLFFAPPPHDNTVLASISKMVQDRGLVTIILFKITAELLLVMDRKSYMTFHLEPLSLTLSDLEMSIQVTGFQWPISTNLFKIPTELLLMMDRKSCMRYHLAPLSLTLSDLDRSRSLKVDVLAP